MDGIDPADGECNVALEGEAPMGVCGAAMGATGMDVSSGDPAAVGTGDTATGIWALPPGADLELPYGLGLPRPIGEVSMLCV